MTLAQRFLPKIPGVHSDTGQLDLTLSGGSEPLGRKLGIAGDTPATNQHHGKGETNEWLCTE